MGFLIADPHTSNLWPVLVLNVTDEINHSNYFEIHQRGVYIILTLGLCQEWEELRSGLRKQLLAMFVVNVWK